MEDTEATTQEMDEDIQIVDFSQTAKTKKKGKKKSSKKAKTSKLDIMFNIYSGSSRGS